MRRDTAHAARDAAAVARVLVVADRAGDPTADLVQSAPGLNEGVAEAAGIAAQRWPTDGIAALVGDLPALRSQELTAALADAANHPRAFVADSAGTGTTLLTARPGVALRPAFGPGSAARHAQLAVAVSAGPGLRADVDTAEDLSRARLLGLGRSTQSVTADSHARCMMTP
jgi:2-phospho-L-lactate guanylyltransferase